MKRKIKYIALFSSLFLVGCANSNGGTISNPNVNTNPTDSNEIPDEVDNSVDKETILTSTNYILDSEDNFSSIPENVTEINLVQDNTLAGSGYTVVSNVITISTKGNYLISGTLSDGYIVVKKNIQAHIFLNGVSITSLSGSPLIYKKDTTGGLNSVITLIEGTTNYFTDANSEEYTSGDYDEDTLEFDNNAAIFAKRNLTINGSGTLNVRSYFHQGIRSKNSLKILGGTINVNSYSHSIKGDEAVFTSGGVINAVSSEGDGIKTDEPDLGTDYDASLYNAKFTDTTITIESKYDGIQVYNMLCIDGGYYKITNGGGTNNRKEYLNNPERDENGNIVYEDGEISYPSSKSFKTSLDYSNDISSGASSIYLIDGTFVIDSVDDAVNANNGCYVDGGVFTINAGDDGVHADSKIEVNSGEINIVNSYEGIEASNIEVNGGSINITSTDDGINASNKLSNVLDGSYDEACQMYFNGGNVVVNAEGDGIDSNGCVQFNSGIVYINGPSGSGNSAIDTNGGYVINGGEIVALGSSGMLELPKSNSAQNSATLSASIKSGDLVNVYNSSNDEMLSYIANKSSDSISVSLNSLELNQDYKIYINNSLLKSWTQDSVVYSDINAQNGVGEGKPGGTGQPGGGNKPGH